MIQNIDFIDKNLKKDSLIVNPINRVSLEPIKEASEAGFIEPLLIGDKVIIESLLNDLSWHLQPDKIINSNSEVESSKIACKLASDRIKDPYLIVKGHLHTDVLMSEYIKSEYKLLIKGRRLSHIWFMTFPDNARSPIIITDGALNISPNVETKKHIINNVIEFTSKLPNFDPKIAILSATEEILPQMQSSVDAKDLVEWSRIEHPTMDIHGPFAFDNAISSDAAKIKGISNSVAGNANVIVVPNVETGNSLVKIMVNFMNCTAGGFVTGGISPVVITSRSDSSSSRLSSIVNAVLSTL